MTTRSFRFALLVAAAATALGCSRKEVVAKYDGRTLTLRELQEAVENGPPFQKARFATPEGRKAVLQEVLNQKLLVWEAERRGLARDPQLRFQVEDYRERLLQNKLQQALAESSQPTPQDIEVYYKAHPEIYNIPALARVRRILVPTATEARRLLQQVRKAGPDPNQMEQTFAQLAQQHSADPLTKAHGGDTGYFPEGARPDDPAFEHAAFALEKHGELGGPVHTRNGWDLLFLMDHRPAIHRTSDEARDDIRQRIIMERQRVSLDRLLQQIRERTHLKVYEDRLK